jgi:TRAP-type C4-dicarboxylate transport system substrate-binding protein
MKKITTIFTTALISAGLLAASAVQADDGMKHQWRYASVAPPGTPWVNHGQAFRDALFENTDGAIDITMYNGGQLGTEVATLRELSEGTIDIGAFSTAGLSSLVPEMALATAPYLFNSYAEVDCTYDNYLIDTFTPLVEKANLKLIQWNEVGYTHLMTQSKVLTPDDARALKMRTSISPAGRNYWKALGNDGIYIPFMEMASALQTGLIQGASMQTIPYVAMGFGQLAPHFTLTRDSHDAGAILMNLDLWNSLSADNQAAIMNSLQPQQNLRAGVRGMAAYLLGKAKAAGIQVYELTDEQHGAFRTAVQDMYAPMIEDMGGDAATLWPEVLAARDQCRASLTFQ